VYTFPGYPSSAKAWLWLILFGMATGGAFRVMMLFFPS
jgi:hypothetical protein